MSRGVDLVFVTIVMEVEQLMEKLLQEDSEAKAKVQAEFEEARARKEDKQ